MKYNSILEEAAFNKGKVKTIVRKLKKYPSQQLDEAFHTSHEEVFKEIDCLACANCCSTTSPIFNSTDIARLSKVFKMKEAEFIDQYLQKDEDDDWVLQSAPCPFLGADNYCLVYEDRPKACREYPHTNRKKMRQILKLTERNAQICPAVYRILQQLNTL